MRFITTIFVVMVICTAAQAQWKGAAITDKSQINEVVEFSNAFSYSPKSLDDLREILIKNNGRMMPFLELARYFWNSDKGVYEWRDITELKIAIGRDRLVVVLDEPFWWIRQACQNSFLEACAEISTGYEQTQLVFNKLKYELGTQILHIEAYLELIQQKQTNPNTNVILIEAADHLGFDCYGAFNNCHGYPQMQYAIWVYEAIQGTGKKIFLVPGASNFAKESVVIDQLRKYFDLYKVYSDLVSGIGVFVWGDFDGVSGARSNPVLANEVASLLSQVP